MRRLVLAVLALLVLPQAGFAQEDVKWVRKAMKGSCDTWGYCAERYEWVRYAKPRPHGPPPVVHHVATPAAASVPLAAKQGVLPTHADVGPLCLNAPVRERGEERNTINGAKIDAVRRWQASVRADFGERFMDISSAKNIVYDCHRSSANESFAGKAAEFIGRQIEKFTGDEEDAYKKRCVVVATPCREPLRPVSYEPVAPGGGGTDGAAVQEMIQELERQGYKVSTPPGGVAPATPGVYQPKKRWYYRYIGKDKDRNR
ncbi:MAG: hypothetical protein NW223_07850 [Hyphomicrobiaceae bacterium]|nr:hypothetical protein [Hyphomicrobiaceae bacterium]